jgi:ankyrin repeat protein
MDSANDDDDCEGLKEIYESMPLEKRKVLLTFTNSSKMTALHLAAYNGHTDSVRYLVDMIVKDFPAH